MSSCAILHKLSCFIPNILQIFLSNRLFLLSFVVDSDGLVSYRSSQGNGRANGPGLGDLRDIGYDGRRLAYGTKRGVLSGGLGQLVDGVLGSNVPWNDTNNTAWVSWIGWRDPITEHPTVTFQFSSIRKFSKIRFHVLNQPGAEKLLFGKVSWDNVVLSRMVQSYKYKAPLTLPAE